MGSPLLPGYLVRPGGHPRRLRPAHGRRAATAHPVQRGRNPCGLEPEGAGRDGRGSGPRREHERGCELELQHGHQTDQDACPAGARCPAPHPRGRIGHGLDRVPPDPHGAGGFRFWSIEGIHVGCEGGRGGMGVSGDADRKPAWLLPRARDGKLWVGDLDRRPLPRPLDHPGGCVPRPCRLLLAPIQRADLIPARLRAHRVGIRPLGPRRGNPCGVHGQRQRPGPDVGGSKPLADPHRRDRGRGLRGVRSHALRVHGYLDLRPRLVRSAGIRDGMARGILLPGPRVAVACLLLVRGRMGHPLDASGGAHRHPAGHHAHGGPPLVRDPPRVALPGLGRVAPARRARPSGSGAARHRSRRGGARCRPGDSLQRLHPGVDVGAVPVLPGDGPGQQRDHRRHRAGLEPHRRDGRIEPRRRQRLGGVRLHRGARGAARRRPARGHLPHPADASHHGRTAGHLDPRHRLVEPVRRLLSRHGSIRLPGAGPAGTRMAAGVRDPGLVQRHALLVGGEDQDRRARDGHGHQRHRHLHPSSGARRWAGR